MFHEYSSAARGLGSCITPRWSSASTSPARNTSRAFLLRRSTWWCSMSLGRPGIGRRSSPTICQSRSWCSRRATSRPSRPLIPVMTTLRGREGLPEDVFALTQPQVDHRLDPVLDRLDLLVEHLV